jgi:hypothetical protein
LALDHLQTLKILNLLLTIKVAQLNYQMLPQALKKIHFNLKTHKEDTINKKAKL